MATRDYGLDGIPSEQNWGDHISDSGYIANLNDGDDNSYYRKSKGIQGTQAGTFEVKLQLVPTHFIEEIKFITEFTGGNHNPPDTYYNVGFKLQYWNGSWQTLYNQVLTTDFSEAKTTRSYTNAGAGFENVTYARMWITW